MWVLLVILFGQQASIDDIDGFTSRAQCEAVGHQIIADTNDKDIKTICIEVD